MPHPKAISRGLPRVAPLEQKTLLSLIAQEIPRVLESLCQEPRQRPNLFLAQLQMVCSMKSFRYPNYFYLVSPVALGYMVEADLPLPTLDNL